MVANDFAEKKRKLDNALKAHLQDLETREENEKRRAFGSMRPGEYEAWIKENERNKECYWAETREVFKKEIKNQDKNNPDFIFKN